MRAQISNVNKSDLKIVFLGTPEFAVASLEAILNEGYNVVGVITAPDRKGGRGMKKTIESSVKKYAFSKNLKILQPTNLKNPQFLEELKALGANLQVVVAFRMLPRVVWDMPTLGTYNLHGSLLPKYRGAAPINWAIMNGEQKTGVTTFKLKHEIDTGSIALQAEVPIHPADYLNDVHDRMMVIGANLVTKTIRNLCSGHLILKEQDESGITKAPKIFHDDCLISFDNTPSDIFNKIRGLSPYPAAWMTIGEKKIKIYKAMYSYHQHQSQPGDIITDGKSYLAISCLNGLIFLTEIQPQGKTRMLIKDYLNGLQITERTQPYLRRIQSPWSY